MDPLFDPVQLFTCTSACLKYFNSLSSGYHHANPYVNSLPLPEAFLIILSSYNFNRTLAKPDTNNLQLLWGTEMNRMSIPFPGRPQASGFSKMHTEPIITASWTEPLPSYKQEIRRSHIQEQMPILAGMPEDCTSGSKIVQGYLIISLQKSLVSIPGTNLQIHSNWCIHHFMVPIMCTGLPGHMARLSGSKHSGSVQL